MRVRTALISLGCSVAILVAGCSSTLPGIPQGPDGGGGGGGLPTVGTTHAPGGGGGLTGSTPTANGNGDGDTGTGAGGAPGLPNLTDLTDLSDLAGLGGLGGLAGPCLAAAGAVVAIGSLILAPTLGGSLTQAQVDQAFSGLDQLPANLQPAVQTLHTAANAAVGKSGAEALSILSDSKVSDALNQLSDYVDKQCGAGSTG